MAKENGSYLHFSGNYVDVVHKINKRDPEGVYKDTGKANYIEEIKKDKHRTCYINPHDNIDVLQTRLSDTSDLTHFAFFQGDHTAENFNYILEPEQKFAKKPLDIPLETLGFSYVDDSNRLCGCSLAYTRDDTNLEVPENERPYVYSVAIIKNVTAHPQDREVHIFRDERYFLTADQIEEGLVATRMAESLDAHSETIKNIKKEAQETDSHSILSEIFETTDSESINSLLRDIIKPDHLDRQAFEKLNARLQPNQNIDKRDEKLDRLYDLFIVLEKLNRRNLSQRNDTMAEISKLLFKATNDINYFKDKSLEDIDAIVKNYEQETQSIPNHENPESVKQNGIMGLKNAAIQSAQEKSNAIKAKKEIQNPTLEQRGKQSFWGRNKGWLTVLGLGILGLAAAVASVFFAPIAVPIAIGVAGGAASYLGAKKVRDRQKQLSEYHESQTTEEKEIDNKCATNLNDIQHNYHQGLIHLGQNEPSEEEEAPEEASEKASEKASEEAPEEAPEETPTRSL